jgi:hypothetical protein
LNTDNSDVVLVIDNSGSMRENDPSYLRLAAAKLFIDLAEPGDKIGIVVMSGGSSTRKLSKRMIKIKADRSIITEQKDLIDSLRNEPMGDETHMGSALSLAYDMLDAEVNRFDRTANPRQFVVMLTDGLPTGAGQRELVDQAITNFESRVYWKVFTIALGAGADPAYMHHAVAEPTGAEVVIAQHAGELLDRYLDVYARAGDNRFIDRITVQPNRLAPLINVQPDQQPTQLSVVLVRGDTGATINNLIAPDNADVVDPFYQNTVRRGAEPEYELYTVPLEAQVGLVGRWQINVEQPQNTPLSIVVLSKSRLRLHLSIPAALRPNDDLSLRYHPVGRPLLLMAGAQVAVTDPLTTAVSYQWVTEMTPAVRQIESSFKPWVELADDGRRHDPVAGDGRYSGLYQAFEEAGDYRLRMEIPARTEEPIHIYREYTIRAAPLPTMTITLPPAATTLPIHTPFTGLIDLPEWADFNIGNVTFPVAYIQRPDGFIDPVEVQSDGNNRFQFTYTPEFAGSYRVDIAAEVLGNGAAGMIRYVDFDDADFAVTEATPVMAISAAFTETLTYQRGMLEVPLTIRSQSSQPELLYVDVSGLPGGWAFPDEVLIDPQTEVQRTFAIHLSDAEWPENGEFTLEISSPGQQVIVNGSVITVPFQRPWSLMPLMAVALVGLTGIGLFIYRKYRRQRQNQAPYLAQEPRRLA